MAFSIKNLFRIGYSILAHCALRASSRCTYLFLMNVRTCVHMLYRGMLDLQTLIYFPFEQTIAHFIYNSNTKSLRFKMNYSSNKLRKTQNEIRLSICNFDLLFFLTNNSPHHLQFKYEVRHMYIIQNMYMILN